MARPFDVAEVNYYGREPPLPLLSQLLVGCGSAPHGSDASAVTTVCRALPISNSYGIGGVIIVAPPAHH